MAADPTQSFERLWNDGQRAAALATFASAHEPHPRQPWFRKWFLGHEGRVCPLLETVRELRRHPAAVVKLLGELLPDDRRGGLWPYFPQESWVRSAFG